MDGGEPGYVPIGISEFRVKANTIATLVVRVVHANNVYLLFLVA